MARLISLTGNFPETPDVNSSTSHNRHTDLKEWDYALEV